MGGLGGKQTCIVPLYIHNGIFFIYIKTCLWLSKLFHLISDLHMKVLVYHQKVMLQPLGYHCHPTWTSFGKARLTVELVVSVSGWSIFGY